MLCIWEWSIKVKDCYFFLGVDWSVIIIDVWEVYLKFVKLYYLDCGRNMVDVVKFLKIEYVYRVVMDYVISVF